MNYYKKNILYDVIQNEISNDAVIDKFRKFNIHNSLISKLYHHYICVEMCENFYDSEPHIDDDLFDKYSEYYDYLNGRIENKADFDYISCRNAYFQVQKIYEEYEKERLYHGNWIEPFFKGNWGISQKDVDNIARNTLLGFKKESFSKKDRCYIGFCGDEIRIYLYGRDLLGVDYWFIFKRSENKCK